MAFNAGTVEGRLRLNTEQFRAALRAAGGVVKRFRSFLNEGGGSLGGFRTQLQTAANATIFIRGQIEALRAVVRSIVAPLSAASQAASTYEQSVKNLSVSLKLAGTSDVPRVTKSLEDFAAATQRSTAFGDTQVLGVAQILTVLGVQESKLKQATKAVLDYSAATGRDAVESAKQFAKTLSGLTGELGETFPQLRSLSVEQLKSGEAFNQAEKLLGGFAEQAAKTTSGSLSQLQNAFTDLRKEVGFALNEVVGPFATRLREILEKLTDQLRNNKDAAQGLRDAVKTAFEFVAGGLRFAIDAALRLKTVFLTVKAVLATFQANFIASLFGFSEVVTQVFADISGFLAGMLEKAAELPGLPESIRAGIEGAAKAMRGFERSTASAAAEQRNMMDAAQAVADEAWEAARAADAQRLKILAGSQELTGMAGAMADLANLSNTVAINTGKAATAAKSYALDTNRARAAAEGALGVWRAAAGAGEETAGAAEDTATAMERTESAIERATGGAERLGATLSRAASSAGEVSSSLAGAAGVGSIPINRGVLSTTSLDFSDPFRAAAQAQTAEQALRRVSTGGFRADLGAFTVNAARAYAEGVRTQANQAIERAISEFTSTVLQELNSQGIFDPAQRSRIVRQRIIEAQRLGGLPQALEGSITQGLR